MHVYILQVISITMLIDFQVLLDIIESISLHTPYCFLQVSTEREICFFNSSWCVIHTVYNIVIIKRLCGPLSLTLLSYYRVILLEILHIGFFNMLYWNKKLVGYYRFIIRLAWCIFIRKFNFKKYSIFGLHDSTNMHVRWSRVYYQKHIFDVICPKKTYPPDVLRVTPK